MSPSQLPAQIVDAVRKRGYDDVQIDHMSPRTLFAEYCEHHGLVGWGDKLWQAMQQLQAPLQRALVSAEPAHEIGLPLPRVAVWLEGGVVQGAVANGKVDVAVIEYGESGEFDRDECFLVPQGDGTESEAIGSVWVAEVQADRTNEIFEAVEARRSVANPRP